MIIEGLQLDADSSSLKLFKQGTGVLNTVASTSTSASVSIPHGYGDDKLLWQVTIKQGSTGRTYTTPLYTNNGRYRLTAELDSTDLVITVTISAAVVVAADTWTYNYRILIP